MEELLGKVKADNALDLGNKIALLGSWISAIDRFTFTHKNNAIKLKKMVADRILIMDALDQFLKELK